jgi:CheY-like chemotaxis protein
MSNAGDISRKEGRGGDKKPCEKNRLLVVDDEKAIRTVFKQILSYGLKDCQIDLAANGQEALNAFMEAHYCLLLMDLNMPVMDGETAFIKITEICEEKNWEMPSVVFCTGYNPSHVIRDVVEHDSHHAILQKPVSNENLLKELRRRI